jgi:hypothetical protein
VTQLMPLVVATLALVSSTMVAEAQSRGGGSTSASIGAITAPRSSTTLPPGSLRTIGVIAAPASSPSSATTTSTSQVIGRPLNQLNLGNTPLDQGATFLATPVGPLPPVPTTNTTFTSGGSSGISLQGGGLDTLEGCISFWDRGTHMTKTEWKVACQRSIAHRDEIQKSYQKSR